MNFDLKTPCNNCPFRRSVQFPLGTKRREEVARSLANDYNTFPCHKTTQFDDDTGELIDTPYQQHCAGAMIVLEKHNHCPSIMMRLAQMSGRYTPEQLTDKEGDVYASLSEFVADDPSYANKTSHR